MASLVSRRWRLTLDLEDASLEPASWADAARWAREAGCGTLSAEGEDGDWAELEFNGTHAAVWFMGSDRVLRRPYFPHRPASDQDIGPFFRGGVRVDSHDEYLGRFMARDEGFRLFAELLGGGRLPAAVPEDRADQPLLPGMGEVAARRAESRVVEWRVHCHADETRG
jgi:hypothetical protein